MICSSWYLFDLEVKNIYSILKCNDYPIYFIDRCLKTFLNKKLCPSNPTVPDKKKFINVFGIPYIGFDSIKFKKKLSHILCSVNADIFMYSYTFKVSNYFSLKDRTNISLKSGVIYKYTCQVDPDVVYISKPNANLVEEC